MPGVQVAFTPCAPFVQRNSWTLRIALHISYREWTSYAERFLSRQLSTDCKCESGEPRPSGSVLLPDTSKGDHHSAFDGDGLHRVPAASAGADDRPARCRADPSAHQDVAEKVSVIDE